ncbi:MAG: TIM barrel protein [Acutalibacteraceae bacterium]
MGAKFGPAGNADSFAAQGYKSTLQAPEFVSKFGLDCYEYQCGRGVRVSDEHAAAFRRNAEEFGIAVSLHSPYYISLSSVEEEKRLKSVDYILQSAAAVEKFGGDRVVVHSGSCSKITREQALALAKDTLQRALAALDEQGLSQIHLCPETMGKINQLGTLDEVIELCRLDERLIPCIDFGHLNARTLGQMNSKEAFSAALDRIKDRLGSERERVFHAHFSKIEYSAGGEKKHLTFADEIYGPDFEPLGELIAKRNLSPTIICESAGTQAEDALYMKQCFESYAGGN